MIIGEHTKNLILHYLQYHYFRFLKKLTFKVLVFLNSIFFHFFKTKINKKPLKMYIFQIYLLFKFIIKILNTQKISYLLRCIQKKN